MSENKVLSFFKEILCIPRESGHEEHIVEYLLEFARQRNLEAKRDATGNVLIVKEAAPGKENVPTVVLQSHSDMVCEKKAGVEHDFSKDPIQYVERDGWWIAEDTTLGADCGIGIAATLALFDSDIPTGRLEALFTISEETGMDGAFALSGDFITGKILINLDSEDEGQLFIGCAGGIDTTAVFRYNEGKLAPGMCASRFTIKGCIGGHSGDDINKERANAVQCLARFLYETMGYDMELCSIDGGNKRNAIAREASAVIAFPEQYEDEILAIWNEFCRNLSAEYAATDPGISFEAEPVTWTEGTVETEVAYRLIAALVYAPHGVLAMSTELKGIVETSSNLASVKMKEGGVIRVGTSQRSSIDSARRFAATRVEAAFAIAGAEVTHESEYPGWKPRLNSPILNTTVESYRKLFNQEPIVRAIHAGLECGLFLEKYPDLDMISFGPTILGVHAPGERLDLQSVDKFWKLLIDVLQKL
ncbi:MAG: aminoacyl-histidine dipeptidase [Bacteroidales bacterium]|nr:aminoacyl-histidine dipeptidase [Bacteroidales bacterium]